MKLRSLIPALAAAFAFAACSSPAPKESIESITTRVFDVAAQQAKLLVSQLDSTNCPRTITKDGKFHTASPEWWCSGFFPGSLWYIYEYSGDDTFKTLAEAECAKLVDMQYYTDGHDIGFVTNCSFGNGLRLTGNESYKEILHNAAHSLATRYNPVVGCTRSWNNYTFPVIIDNMMNLELLVKVADMFDEDSLKDMALSHARKTIKNHFRDDYSSYHLVDYNPETGEVIHKQTVQGYADNSSWGRGQAWGLYGFTMMFEKTGEADFLAQAENIAKYLIGRLPEDGIPYWDFDDPAIPNVYRDASAGAIMCSAFVKLSTLTADKDLSAKCLAMAETQIRTLSGPYYLAEPGANGGFLLKHSVGSLPGNSEVDVPLIYADYYYLEALMRYRELGK